MASKKTETAQQRVPLQFEGQGSNASNGKQWKAMESNGKQWKAMESTDSAADSAANRNWAHEDYR